MSQQSPAHGTPDSWMRDEGPTPFQVMLRSAPADYLTNIQEEQYVPPPKYPVYYFFYGTLTAPETLKRILDLSDELKMRKAKSIGYALAKWGDYPALIDGESGQEVPGYAYIVKSEEEAEKLAYYETNAYEEADCLIFFDDEEEPVEISGKTFKYAGDAQALLEQRFDRKLWTRQMAGRLV
ncbi:hypothetical protein N7528_008856 [Penicillium herquei]|nr:hypothetical protein N7528_008856 [Penicillium herquei]